MVHEYEADGFHDAATPIDLVVVPLLNRPSNFASWHMASTRAAMAVAVIQWRRFLMGTFVSHVGTH
jgi:hypothetical protein